MEQIEIISAILAFVLLPLFWGYDDGYMKLNKTEAHWPKYIMFICIGALTVMGFDLIILAYWAIIWKPLFDIGWSRGCGYNYIFIGTTSIFDRVLHKIGFVKLEAEKFPIITLLYQMSIFIGIGLIITTLIHVC